MKNMREIHINVVDINKLILKLILKFKRPRIPNIILNKKSKEGPKLSTLKITTIKTMWYYQSDQ
jgi:hypothetical protein